MMSCTDATSFSAVREDGKVTEAGRDTEQSGWVRLRLQAEVYAWEPRARGRLEGRSILELIPCHS